MRPLLYWLPAVLYMGIIFYLSSYPAPEIVDRFDFYILFMKFAHIVEYGPLGFLFYYALRRTTKLRLRDAILFSVLLAGGYGITDELHQSLIPGRSAMVGDALTDFISGGIGAVAGYALARSLSIRARFSPRA